MGRYHTSIVLFCALVAAYTPAQAETSASFIPQSTLLQYLAGKGNFTLIDARSPEEYAAGHIYGAVNVPHDADLAAAGVLPADTAAPLVVYCKSGKRAAALKESLAAAGYGDVRVLGPAQILWSESLPVFNCGTPAAEPGPVSARITEMTETGEN